ncbi:MAG: Type 1 glutamine amidotransferase-like domain-containing protein [Pseudobacteriovorax sp.]|nr:Type 1 glutamine amidotransferase-like domain-containing protein [Pseudobacteriovorax sp.]
MDTVLLDAVGKMKPLITFIGADEFCEEYFHEFEFRFSRLTDFRVVFIDPRESIEDAHLTLLQNSDIVYLSGGNTFELMHHLRRHQLMPLLKKLGQEGKHMAGHSAGAIAFTPNIRMASVPDFDRDENLVQLADWRALRLVGLEFFPHYRNNRKYSEALSELSKLTQYPIFAVSDGAGFMKDANQTRLFGRVWLFNQGTKVRIN